MLTYNLGWSRKKTIRGCMKTCGKETYKKDVDQLKPTGVRAEMKDCREKELTRSAPHPRSKNTPIGGRRMAKLKEKGQR